ncbi:MAG: aminopeptidase P family protein [Deltaproteobacteria bacterium]|nr:aminopeptidase P family protein [Deltaproteobacteria bacterium]MBW2042354.1 aminopeptidase P family protein [Deltaproteobacteria bacterium]MBW2133446.1 aminopeptidase P family protein [Deltaproteobacteria bacterium]
MPSARAFHRSRIQRLRKAMKKEHIDTFMVLFQENRRYLSGFTGEDTQFDESAGALFITGEQQVLATDFRYDTQARSEAPLFEVFRYREGLAKVFPEILKSLGTERLGFESIRMSVMERRRMEDHLKKAKMKVELVATAGLVEQIRMVKSAAETAVIRKALRLAENAFERIIPLLKPGISEKEAAWALEKEMRESGAEGVSFPVIAAFGENSALPHAIPGDRPLKAGEPVLLDWGARLDGYCSDISRSFCIGKPDALFKKIFRAVHDAQKKAIEAIHAGASTREVDRVARSLIHRRGFKGRFGHGLGHGVGLAIHEAPRLGPAAKDTLIAPGMVFTVEPGIYIPEWGGIRLENMVFVKKGGAEVLNRLPIEIGI